MVWAVVLGFLAVCVCEDGGRQAPAEAAESVLMFKRRAWEHGLGLREPRAEITGKSEVRTEKGITEIRAASQATPHPGGSAGAWEECVWEPGWSM